MGRLSGRFYSPANGTATIIDEEYGKDPNDPD